MAKQDIDRGTVAGDGTGENLFDAFGKCINNFDDLYQYWANLASTATGNGASDVGIEDSAGNFTAANVEAALAEVWSKLFQSSNPAGATWIGVQDSGGYFAAVTVETVLQEIVADYAATTDNNGASKIGIYDPAELLIATDVEEALNELAKGIVPPAMSSSVAIEYDIVNITTPLPTNSGAVRLHSFADCFIEFGDNTVTADGSSSIYFASGTEVFGVPAGATHIAVKSAGEVGALNVVGLDANYKEQLTTNEVIAYTAGSNRVALPTGDKVRLFAMTDCYINFDDDEVMADETSLFFEAGTEIVNIPSAATHIAAKRYVSDGGLYISGVN